ncbi:VOC family protein [Azospirillum sp.]|uniref:VOC family protein n=1 Tax=Azospirillum sp. TaxID=34012 RepID=UPI003D71A4D8
MPHGIDGIDHLVIAVRDLDKAREAYARLGFTLTARGRHTELKSANHTIMFPDDYVELLAIEEPNPATAAWSEFLKTREGLAAAALKTADARSTQAELAGAGLSGGEAVDFGRPVDLPEGRRDARFTITQVAPAATPGGRMFLCQHHTRDVVWRPEYLTHENGATALAALIVAADDPEAVAGPYATLFGTHVEPRGTVRVVQTGGAPIVVAPPPALVHLWADDPVLSAPRPCFAGFAVKVKDFYAAQQVLQKSKFPTIASEGVLRVASRHTHGAAIAFAENFDLARVLPG